MKPALLLIDLQYDFLSAPSLQPAAGQIVDHAAALLQTCRRYHIPVLHLWTTVTRSPDNRMPHWKLAREGQIANGRWICEQGTPGHLSPEILRPIPSEPIIHKQFFSGFGNQQLQKTLQDTGCDTLILAGVHLHGCIRATALDAYERGYKVLIAQEAVGSDDPVHAAITRRYLADRCMNFVSVYSLIELFEKKQPVQELLAASIHFQHRSPVDRTRILWSIPHAGSREVSQSAGRLEDAWRHRRETSIEQRADKLRQLAILLLSHQESLTRQIVEDVGKPIRMARAEVRRSADLLHSVASQAANFHDSSTASGTRFRFQPLGVVAIITPWNNPLAIPIGRIAPALLYGNAALWKPALQASMIAGKLLELWKTIDDSALLELVCGGGAGDTAAFVAADPRISGVTLSGSLQAGYALGEIAARRHVPFHAELGGNNAAIIAEDVDLAHAAREIAAGAFGFAGQRCTANRRAIVIGDRARHAAWLEEIIAATRENSWGDPSQENTVMGPVIGRQKCDEISALLQRAAAAGTQIIQPQMSQNPQPALLENGAFSAPSLVVAPDPSCEIVQEESFGPILVTQPAATFDEALHLCNGVRQGLVAACFTQSFQLQRQFLSQAKAGVLKLNQSTSDADASSPFGGWKASGIGPAEHGPADREFFTRVQTIYEG